MQKAEHVCVCSTRVMNPNPKENWPLQGALSLETQRFLPDKESKTEKSVIRKNRKKSFRAGPVFVLLFA